MVPVPDQVPVPDLFPVVGPGPVIFLGFGPGPVIFLVPVLVKIVGPVTQWVRVSFFITNIKTLNGLKRVCSKMTLATKGEGMLTKFEF